MSRIIVRIELSPKAANSLKVLTAKYGMTQLSMLSRITEWLAKQPNSVQAGVLGQLASEDSADLEKLILKHMTGGK